MVHGYAPRQPRQIVKALGTGWGRDGFERYAFGMHMMHAFVAGFNRWWEHRQGQMRGLHEAPTVPVPVSGVGAGLSRI